MASKKTTTKKAEEEVVKTAPKTKAVSKPDPEADMDLKEFVEQAYLSILKRPADAEGLKNYMQVVQMHGRPRAHVLHALENSAEAKSLK